MVEVDVDVLIAGGSVAGIATAAALREFGWSVLIVEPGQRTDRRLAGELIHPSGVAGLIELGLYDSDAFAGAVPIEGFVVFPDAGEDSERVTLCYPPDAAGGSRAIALDYGRLRTNLQDAARGLDHVTFMDGARVSGIATDEPDRSRVTIEVGGESRVVTCRMVVAADGASSTMRSLAGIKHTRRNISTIAGYVVENAPLPAPGFGHVFIGGDAVVLAYQIGENRARVMFDQPIDRDGIPAAQHRAKLLESLPADLRDTLAAAMQVQKPLCFKSAEVIAATATRGRVVLVGDAGGSCHPLTATGMTAGIRDAIRLRDALRRHKADIPAAFRTYSQIRRTAQRSRRMVASALHDTYSSREPEIRLVRAGLLRYWTQDVSSQTSTMAILAMTDDRVTSAFWHLSKVIRHGLADHWNRRPEGRLVRIGLSAKLVAALSAMALRHLSLTVRAR